MNHKRNEKQDTVPDIYMQGADETTFPIGRLSPNLTRYSRYPYPVIPDDVLSEVVSDYDDQYRDERPEYHL